MHTHTLTHSESVAWVHEGHFHHRLEGQPVVTRDKVSGWELEEMLHHIQANLPGRGGEGRGGEGRGGEGRGGRVVKKEENKQWKGWSYKTLSHAM